MENIKIMGGLEEIVITDLENMEITETGPKLQDILEESKVEVATDQHLEEEMSTKETDLAPIRGVIPAKKNMIENDLDSIVKVENGTFQQKEKT